MAFGMPVETAVTKIINGIQNDMFYILTHVEAGALIGLRNMGIMNGSRPMKIVR